MLTLALARWQGQPATISGRSSGVSLLTALAVASRSFPLNRLPLAAAAALTLFAAPAFAAVQDPPPPAPAITAQPAPSPEEAAFQIKGDAFQVEAERMGAEQVRHRPEQVAVATTDVEQRIDAELLLHPHRQGEVRHLRLGARPIRDVDDVELLGGQLAP